ncbi:MAG TPA: HEAT repeat domain-containing protein [Gemmataceae bacterium]|nr:HEAT repeat domain-containing protein [Gemmataceae bacterium]
MGHEQQLRASGRPGWVRMLGLGFLLAGLTGGLDRSTAAAPIDPVEELRQAIKLDRGSSYDFLNREAVQKARQAFRKKNLTEKANRLTSLGDLARALMLIEWEVEVRATREGIQQVRPDPELARVDDEVRDMLFERFTKGLHEIAASKNPAACRAAADLVGKTAIEARAAAASGAWLRRRLKELAPLLKDLTEMRNDGRAAALEAVRLAAAQALGQINGAPDEVVPALAKLLDPATGETLAVRRGAAAALANVMGVRNQLRAGNITQGSEVSPQDVVQAGTQVVRVAARFVDDLDRVVSRQAIEAIQQSAAALTENIIPVNASDVERFPPAGRVPTAVEARAMEEYRQEVERERKDLMPLMEALRDSVPVLAEVAADPRRDDHERSLAFGVLEQMGLAHDKLIQRQQSIPEVGGDSKGSQTAPGDGVQPAQLPPPSEAKPLPGGDPLLDGLRAAIHRLRQGIEADTPVRLAAIEAVEALGGSYAREAVPALNRTLTHPNPNVRRAAARVIGKVGPVQTANTVERLAWLLEYDVDLDVRLAAATALQRYGPAARGAVPAVARTIAGRNDAEIRIAAIQTLQGIGPADGKAAVPALAAVLSDPDVRVRREAALTLYRFGPDAAGARAALERAAEDADLEVSRVASAALLDILAAPAGKGGP